MAKIGENIGVRRFALLESTGLVGSYVHGTRIGVLVALAFLAAVGWPLTMSATGTLSKLQFAIPRVEEVDPRELAGFSSEVTVISPSTPTGGDTGSTGWRYQWSAERARQSADGHRLGCRGSDSCRRRRC